MPSAEAQFPSDMEIAFGSYDPEDERRRESLFALGNGLLFTRACPCEAESDDDHHYRGTYLAGCYNRRELTVHGKRFGHDSLVNLPNWLSLSVRIADADGGGEFLSLRRMEVLSYRHTLDMAQGVAERVALVRDEQGRCTRLRERRLVSMARPVLAAIRLEITAENWRGLVEIRSALDADVCNGNTDHRMMPGYRHLLTETADHDTQGVTRLGVRTRQSGIPVWLAARTLTDAPMRRRFAQGDDWTAEYLSGSVDQGRTLAVEKLVTITTGRDPATSSPAEAAEAALAEADSFSALQAAHTRVWRRLWASVGIEADQPELRRAVAFHAFHLLQTISPHSVQVDVGLPPRGWQEAYHGQVFWDEIFAFSFLNHRFPEIARGLLMYRYRRLPEARRAAHAAGFHGAMFPWRSGATGAEETPRFQFNPLSGHWLPDDTRLQRHIGAAIANNIWRYHQATGDMPFLAEYGTEMMVDIARFWCSIARHDPTDDRFDICGVIGPDEYHNAYPGAAHPGLNNNAYTNVMASLTLRWARAALDHLPRWQREALADALQISPVELQHWAHVARRLRLCFHGDGVISQFNGFDRLKPFDGRAFAAEHPDGRVDWMLEARGDTVDAYQVTKQADVLMLLHLLQPRELVRLINDMGYPMDMTTLRRTADYYLDRMTHESSLSRVVCAGALAAFDSDLSWTFFNKAMCIDLDAANSASAEEGLHLGAMAGTLDVLQRHYLGLHVRSNILLVRPSPPAQLGPLRMRLQYQGGFLTLRWDGAALHLQSEAENPLPFNVLHEGNMSPLAPGATMVFEPSRG